MIDIIIRDYLTSAGISAHMEIPEGGGMPPFCVVERTGGGEENHIRRATVTIQSYGDTLYHAAELSGQIIRLMDGITVLPEISACRLNGEYNYTDTTKKQYRYQAVFDVVYYDQEDS